MRRTIDSSRELMFPTLSPEDVQRLRRFATVRRYAAGEALVTTGRVSAGMSVLLSGSVAITGRVGLGRVVPIIELGPGGFLAEAGQLAGRPALVDARAISDVETLLIPTDRLRSVLIAEAELGERIMRALLLRRVGLIEAGAGGPVLIGPAVSPDLVRLQGFLARNAMPAPGARSRRRSRGGGAARAVRAPARRPPARGLPRRHRCSRIPAKPTWPAPSA